MKGTVAFSCLTVSFPPLFSAPFACCTAFARRGVWQARAPVLIGSSGGGLRQRFLGSRLWGVARAHGPDPLL